MRHHTSYANWGRQFESQIFHQILLDSPQQTLNSYKKSGKCKKTWEQKIEIILWHIMHIADQHDNRHGSKFHSNIPVTPGSKVSSPMFVSTSEFPPFTRIAARFLWEPISSLTSSSSWSTFAAISSKSFTSPNFRFLLSAKPGSAFAILARVGSPISDKETLSSVPVLLKIPTASTAMPSVAVSACQPHMDC